LAFTRKHELDAASAEYAQMAAIAESGAMDELILYSFAQASTMLDIASHLLAGELAGAQGGTAKWLAELQEAVALQDSLHYIEPPAWHYPVRHYLGAALLALGRPAEAEAVYREDLRQYPKNGWSLFGLAQSLEAQGKTAEAADAQQQFEEAWQHADVTLIASRF
jgi:tetratricopeptide (TPR) repeat protein